MSRIFRGCREEPSGKFLLCQGGTSVPPLAEGMQRGFSR
jgi:hypothetical protein